MDDKTICNGRGQIPYKTSMMRGIMDVEYVNSEVEVE